jgi:hypothetical protein
MLRLYTSRWFYSCGRLRICGGHENHWRKGQAVSLPLQVLKTKKGRIDARVGLYDLMWQG